jgi:hypothetical protein
MKLRSSIAWIRDVDHELIIDKAQQAQIPPIEDSASLKQVKYSGRHTAHFSGQT